MTFFEDDLLPCEYLTDDEIAEQNEILELQDYENSIPTAAERNRSLTWKAQFFPAKISPKSENGEQT